MVHTGNHRQPKVIYEEVPCYWRKKLTALRTTSTASLGTGNPAQRRVAKGALGALARNGRASRFRPWRMSHSAARRFRSEKATAYSSRWAARKAGSFPQTRGM